MYEVHCRDSEIHSRCLVTPPSKATCRALRMSRGTRCYPLPSGSLNPKWLYKVIIIVHHGRCWVQHGMPECLKMREEAGEVRCSEGP